MLGDDRRTIRSPTTSRNGSDADGPMSRAANRPYQARSSFTEDNERDDNEYEDPSNDADEPTRNDRPPPAPQDQYIAALRYRFPNRARNDYAYSKPPGPSIPVPPPAPSVPPPATTTTTSTSSNPSGAPRSGAYQTTSRPTIGRTGTTLDIGGDRTFPVPPLRRVTPEQQNNYARRIAGESPLPGAASQPTTPAPTVRITEPNTGVNQTTPSGYPSQPAISSRGQESTFEKVPSHGGPVSYLGTGTFSQFEHCLRECLERERRQTGMASHISRQEIPPSTSVHEYGYDSGLPSSRPVLHSTSNHFLSDYPSRAMGTFTIDDIRHINVALSRSGISLFPYERPFCRDVYPCSPSVPYPYPNERHRTGEVVSACRVVEEDPALLYNKHGC